MKWISDSEITPLELLDRGAAARAQGAPRLKGGLGTQQADVAIWNLGYDLADGYEAAILIFDQTMSTMLPRSI